MTVLKAENIIAGYGKNRVLDNASFSVEEHSVTGLLGANGCGKTTILKAICGIIPFSGEIIICDKNTKKLSVRDISLMCSYIPQRSGIAIDISALDVVLMGFNPELKLLEAPNKEMKEKSFRMLSLVGLSDKAEENYNTFSEGQKQLCILARSMVRKCSLMLMDEPESALDFGGRYTVLSAVKNIVSEKSSALITLHDPQLALNTCDKLLLMKDGTITAEIYPENDTTEDIEDKLQEIYGALSVQKVISKSGTSQFVLIKE